jgi:hypothetical protein
MNAQSHDASSIGDVITGAATGLAALGILIMTLFPFAIPGILLTVALAVPLVLIAVVVGLVAAFVAGLMAAVAAGLRVLRPARLTH